MKYYMNMIDDNKVSQNSKLVTAREVLTAFDTLTKKCYNVMKDHYYSISIFDENGAVKRTFRY